MADLKLKSITIRNWERIRNASVEFPESGLILIQGINTSSGGALSSVGAGKSSLGEAICRSLLGITGRFQHLKQFSTDKAGDTYVRLEAELQGKPLIIESGYQCAEINRKSEGLRYTYAGRKPVERGHIDQTRADLNRLLGITPELAAWTVFLDGDRMKFNRLSQAESVAIVMTALRQPPWEAYFENSKKKLSLFRRDIENSKTQIMEANDDVGMTGNAALEAKNTLQAAEEAYAEQKQAQENHVKELEAKIEKCQQTVKANQLTMAEIALKLKAMETARAEASHALEIKIHDLEDQMRDLELKRQPLNETHRHCFEAYLRAKTQRENYAKAAKNCPTCQRPLGKIDPAELKRLEKAEAAAKIPFDTAVSQVATFEQTVINLNTELRETNQKHRQTSAKEEVTRLADQHADLEEKNGHALERIHELNLEIANQPKEPSRSAIVKAQTIVDERERELAAAQASLKEKTLAFETDLATLAVMEYWNTAFSPAGIPNLVLRESIAPLNHEARRVSLAMTGGTIEVRYATAREMASGQEKAQLNIEVDNKLGDKDLAGSSKGEGGLANLIIAETLSEIGQTAQRIGFIWLDEISPHQDAKVCQNLYAHLKEKARRTGTLIFLVDHNPLAVNFADHTLIVEKTGDKESCQSVIRWA